MGTKLAQPLWNLDPTIEIDFIGNEGRLPKGTPDTEILEFAAANDFVIVTNDKQTMIGYAKSRIREGLPMAGVIVVTSTRATYEKLTEDLHLICEAMTPEEMSDSIQYIPY